MMATPCASSMRYENIDIGRHVTTMKVRAKRHTGYHFVWRDRAVGRQLVLSAILGHKRKMKKNKKGSLGDRRDNIGIEEKVDAILKTMV